MLVQDPTSTRCLLVTKMEIFTAGANPTSARYNRLVTVLAKLLQTKHNEVFFHGAHPFSKLAIMKNKMLGTHEMLEGQENHKQNKITLCKSKISSRFPFLSSRLATRKSLPTCVSCFCEVLSSFFSRSLSTSPGQKSFSQYGRHAADILALHSLVG